MPIKKQDFIEITYVGRLADTQEIFDTTDEKLAKQAGLTHHAHFGPQVVCVGERHVLPGLDDRFVGAELGPHKYALHAQDGFGKKDASLIQMIPVSQFKKQRIQPVQGMQLDVDGQLGVVKIASGGRVLVDFNHPLAGKDLTYEVTINKVVTDPKAKLKAMLDLSLHTHTELPITMNGDEATVELPSKLPDDAANKFSEQLCKLTGIKKISFTSGKKPEKPAKNLNKEEGTAAE